MTAVKNKNNNQPKDFLMAKKVNEKLQLDLFSIEVFAKPVRHAISQETADWWFRKMRAVVKGAIDWSKVPSIAPRPEQGLRSQPSRPTTSDNDPLRCSSHYNCRGTYRFRR
jgi:hypothetical protein